MLGRLRISPSGFSRLAFASLALNVGIVLSGTAVRVTKSGLGCPTWPTCDGAHVIGPTEYHSVIEWGNRLFTASITLVVLATLAASLLRVPRRRDLVWLSAGLVAGIAAQIVLGGITVLLHLRPVTVMAHFALSMVILVDALALWQRARTSAPEAERIEPLAARLARVTLALTALVILLGTATTAAGPHSGADNVSRLGRLDLAVHLHGIAVAVLLAAALSTRLVLQAVRAPRAIRAVSTAQLYIMGGQGVVGLVQYRFHLPAGLVELHVGLAVGVWVSSVWLVLRTTTAAAAVAAGRERVLRAVG